MVIFTGCDVQQPELIKANKKIAYSSCHNCPEEYMKFVQCEPLKKNCSNQIDRKVLRCDYVSFYEFRFIRKRIPSSFCPY